MNNQTFDYRFAERIKIISDAEIEFNLDEIIKERNVEKKGKQKIHRLGKYLTSVATGNNRETNKAVDSPEEQRDNLGGRIPEETIPEFIVYALHWYIENITTRENIEIRYLFIKYQGTKLIDTLDEKIKQMANDLQLHISFTEDSKLKISYKKLGPKLLRIYFPPDSFGDKMYGLIRSITDENEIYSLLNKEELIENIMSPIIFPKLCSNGLNIKISYPSWDKNGKVMLNASGTIRNFKVAANPKNYKGDNLILECDKNKKDEYGLALECLHNMKEITLNIQKRDRCRFHITFNYADGIREFEVYFFSVPHNTDKTFLPSIQLVGKVINEDEIVRDVTYLVDRNRASLMKKEEGINEGIELLNIEKIDENNYKKKFGISYESGKVDKIEDINFYYIEGNMLVFTENIESKQKKVYSFLNNVLLTRSILQCDDDCKIEKNFGPTVSRDIHFKLTTSGGLIDRDWIFETSDKGIKLFFDGHKGKKRLMEFENVTNSFMIKHRDGWNGKFHIVAGEWVFLFDLAVTE